MVVRQIVKLDKEKPIFQLFFLKDDKNQSVNVEEVEEIDFRIVKKRLEKGECVFITRKRKQQLKTSKVAGKDAAELGTSLTSNPLTKSIKIKSKL